MRPCESAPGHAVGETEWAPAPALAGGAGGSAVAVWCSSARSSTPAGAAGSRGRAWCCSASGIVAGIVSWLVTRWRVHGNDLRIETGLIRRQSIRVPLSRIQAVDVISPVWPGSSAWPRCGWSWPGAAPGAAAGVPRRRRGTAGSGNAARARARPCLGNPSRRRNPCLRINNLRVIFATLLTAPVNVLITIAVVAVVGSSSSPRVAKRRSRSRYQHWSALSPRCSAASTLCTISSSPRAPMDCGEPRPAADAHRDHPVRTDPGGALG